MTISRFDRLPPEYAATNLLATIQRKIREDGRKLVVLDDDPTGVQTVYGIAVLTSWTPEAIARELRAPAPAFFVLTNSRSLPSEEAIAINRSIANGVKEAASRANVDYVMVSRSDSTLRGHFPDETDALAASLSGVDGLILCPAFIDGGRVTIDGTHYLREGARLTPVAMTEFARDASFGYRASHLPDWVAEKTGGRIAASDVKIISITDLREGGPDHVATLLDGLAGGQVVTIDAESESDLEVAALGILQAEMLKKRFIYRCGASLVRARAGVPPRPVLTPAELLDGTTGAGGLVVVGSHVQRTTEQLMRALALPMTVGIEVRVEALLSGEAARTRAIVDAAAAADYAMRQGQTPVISTSRMVVVGAGGQLATGKRVSTALAAIVSHLTERPAYVISKGGITSSEIGTAGLGVERVLVMGQARAGVPVWRLGPETPFPGLPYIVFPCNVGDPHTLADLIFQLNG